jgi:hypothetical protein
MTGLSRRRSRVRVASLPLKSLQIGICVVRPDTKIGSTTQTRVRVNDSAQGNQAEKHESKPFAAASRPTAKAACDYTKWPEVRLMPSASCERLDVKLIGFLDA